MDPMKNPLTISKLNYDCMFLIFSYFTIKELATVRKVSKTFEDLAINCWQLKTKIWTRAQLNTGDVNEFKWHITKLFRHMKCIGLRVYTIEELTLLTKYKFPKVLSLNIAFYPFKTFADYSIKLTRKIARSFPNLEKLVIQGTGINMKRIAKLTNLKDFRLHIYGMEDTKSYCFNTIFTTLQLERIEVLNFHRNAKKYCCIEDFNAITKCLTLKEVEMTGDHLNLISAKLSQLPNLEIITCFRTAAPALAGDRNAFHAIMRDPLLRTRINRVYIGEVLETNETDSIWHALALIPNVKSIVYEPTKAHCYTALELSNEMINLRELTYVPRNERLLAVVHHVKYLQQHLFEIISKAPNLEILLIPKFYLDILVDLSWVVDTIKQRQQKYRSAKMFQLQLLVVKQTNKVNAAIEKYNAEYKGIIQFTFVECLALKILHLRKDSYSINLAKC